MKPRMYRVMIACMLLGLLMLAVSPLSAQTASHSTAPDLAAIDTYVSLKMQDAGIPGLALGIVHGNQVFHLRGFGVADPSGRVVTPQTPFIIGSTSKSFTALAVMQLVEAGKIDLDTPVQHYIPWFRVADPTASAQITVRHLLNQTSGFSYAEGLPQLTGTGDATIEQRVRELSTVTLTQPVGKTYQYSNINYVVLGLLIQVVSGQSYQAYIQQHIFMPLDMRHSYTSQTDAMKDGMATGYRWWFGFALPVDLPYLQDQLPDGFLISSAEDMTHYLITHINQGTYGSASVLSPSDIAALHHPAVRSPDGFYGMGWDIGSTADVPTLSHVGDTANFHTDIVIIPDGQWGFVLLSNANNLIAPLTIMKQIREGLTSLLAGHQVPSGGISLRALYIGIDISLFIISALVVWSLMSLWWWRKRAAQFWQSPSKLIRHIVLPVMGAIFIPLIVLTVLPSVGGFTWPLMALYLPDVSYWLFVILSLSVVAGIMRAVLAILALRKTKEEGAVETSRPITV